MSPSPFGAQQEGPACELERSNFVRSLETGTGRITYVSGPLAFRCPDQLRIRADSAVMESETNFSRLFGRVSFEDPEMRLRAGRAHYFHGEGRLQAWESVELTDRVGGTVITGEELLLLQENEFRPEDRLTVTGGRPHAVLRPEPRPPARLPPPPGGLPPRVEGPEEEAREGAPTEVFGDRFFLEGRRTFTATGSVELQREGMEAFADSMRMDRNEGWLELRRNPRVLGESFELVGREVDLHLPEEVLREVGAREEAILTGEDLRITGSEIRIFLEEGRMDRLTAVHRVPDGEGPAPERPEVLTGEFLLRADSLDVQAPGEVLERVFAAGRARGEALGRDTLNLPDTPELIRRDWLEGDSIVALFGPDSPGPETLAPDPAVVRAEDPGRQRLETLTALGNARSLYRMEPRESEIRLDGEEIADPDGEGPTEDDPEEVEAQEPPPEGEPEEAPPLETVEEDGEEEGVEELVRPRPRFAVHYVVGDRIVIFMDEGEVERMEVEGQTRGLHLEPGEPPPREPPAPDGSEATEGGGIP